MNSCQSNLPSTLTVSLREMRMVFERLVQVARVEAGLVPSLRDCAVYSAALGLGGFSRLDANLELLSRADPHAVTIIDSAEGVVVDGGGQHAWIVALAALDIATERLRSNGEGVVTVRNQIESDELKVVEALAQRFGLKAIVSVDGAGGSAAIKVLPATDASEIAILDRIRESGLGVDAATWWALFHRSADALAPDSYLSRRHAGPIIVEADGKVIGRQDEDETDFSLLLADAPKAVASTSKH
ncbi:hypothetical protein A6U87_12570 [Rhizobium sp. AC44/96]|uniref:hypothetical protein n=1 Tax=Rhizobium sp. AC44/96 TaxID=1841654 RepID=UPI00080F7771|nr:hypothetical protein [Rhizobium sp. AC44/96]OCJ08079.1 hypothetical protein A6U87_12570 [Rhizobium sp. AC44/96]